MHSDGKTIISVDDLSDSQISRLFKSARDLRDQNIKKHLNAVLMTAFFEPSTRTRLSFEMAAHRLGIHVSTFDASSSSMSKGESEEETISNLLAMQPDILVVRKKTPLKISDASKTGIINGGDGTNEHPTQALLDCFTLVEHFQSDNLKNKRILIVGDVRHSRVAHSNIKLLKRLFAEVVVLAPAPFQMDSLEIPHLSSFDDVDGPIDAVMCLRVQKERLSQSFHESEFVRDFMMNIERFRALGENCVVMHPGPMNIGIEISDEVATHQRSLIKKQVHNGVFVRAALLEHCLQRN